MSNLEPWHAWFAWRPVRLLDRRLVWLKRVYRRAWITPAVALRSASHQVEYKL